MVMMYKDRLSPCHNLPCVPIRFKAKKEGDADVVAPMCPECKRVIWSKPWKTDWQLPWWIRIWGFIKLKGFRFLGLLVLLAVVVIYTGRLLGLWDF